MSSNKATFTEAEIHSTFLFNLFLGSLFSVAPQPSMDSFLVNIAIVFIILFLQIITWIKYAHRKVFVIEFQKIFMFLPLSIFLLIPILRVFYDNRFFFLLALGLWLAVAIVTYVYRHTIILGLQEEGTKVLKLFIAYSLIIILFGIIILFYINYATTPSGFVVAVIFYLLNFIFLYLVFPIMKNAYLKEKETELDT
ncbi:hypothetical protein GLW08_20625 [Pontibacillus yanchengensis]|uniref:Uncharacterized protein n=2 Tax=Pontibacillus yanchengensis TaxID=462910 RepID=A0ACC7VLX6_9BACI|nr:hypothetical protein [Pontibacillus yanchengensis]MYL33832.1 hypothetical protein [Pontibacillus yanchengensis]MYL55710.1 hypothetical protein [Pontibacillus yanchengensis]